MIIKFLNPKPHLPNPSHADYIKPGKDLQHLGRGGKKEENMRKKERICVFGCCSGQSCLPYSLPSSSLSPSLSPSFFLSPNFPLSHSHSLSRTSGGYLVWLCDSSLAMGQPALGLDVRLSANVGRRGKVVKKAEKRCFLQTFPAACFIVGCHVIWSLDGAVSVSVTHPCMTNSGMCFFR